MNITAQERSVWLAVYTARLCSQATRDKARLAFTYSSDDDEPVTYACLRIVNMRRLAAGKRAVYYGHHLQLEAASDSGHEITLGEAERAAEAARHRLACVAESMTEHAYQELASALEAPPRPR